MKIGTSNKLKGTVVFVYEGAVNGTVGVELKSGDVITANLTMGSIEELGLTVGKEAYCFVKEADVIVGVDD